MKNYIGLTDVVEPGEDRERLLSLLEAMRKEKTEGKEPKFPEAHKKEKQED